MTKIGMSSTKTGTVNLSRSCLVLVIIKPPIIVSVMKLQNSPFIYFKIRVHSAIHTNKAVNTKILNKLRVLVLTGNIMSKHSQNHHLFCRKIWYNCLNNTKLGGRFCE